MGRKTFESIGRKLPNRENIIISRNLDAEYAKENGITVFDNIEDVIKKYEDVKQKLNKDIVGVNDLKKFNISTKSFTKFWGSYANFIEEYEQVDVQVKHFYYTEEELIKMYIDFSNLLYSAQKAFSTLVLT